MRPQVLSVAKAKPGAGRKGQSTKRHSAELQRAEAQGNFQNADSAWFAADDRTLRHLEFTGQFPVEGHLLRMDVQVDHEFGVPVNIPMLQ